MAKLLNRGGKLLKRGTALVAAPCPECCGNNCPPCILVSGTIAIPSCGEGDCASPDKNVTFLAKLTNPDPDCTDLTESWSTSSTAGGYAERFCVTDPDGTFVFDNTGASPGLQLAWISPGTWRLRFHFSYSIPCGVVFGEADLFVFAAGPPGNFPTAFSGTVTGADFHASGFMCCSAISDGCAQDTAPFEFSLPDLTISADITLSCGGFVCRTIDCCVANDCTGCADSYTVVCSGYEICSGCSSGSDPEEFCYVFDPVNITVTRVNPDDCFWSGFAERNISPEGCDTNDPDFTEFVAINLYCQVVERTCYWFLDVASSFWPCVGSRKITDNQCPSGSYPSQASLGGDPFCTETFSVS